MAILAGVGIVVSAWLLLTAVGMVAVAALPGAQHREDLTPAAPVVGALVLIVALHLTALALPAMAGVPVVLLAVAVAALHPLLRRRVLAQTRRGVATLALCAALGVPAVAIGLLPLRQDSRPVVVQPTPNNDAYAFVTEADWLLHHSAVEYPDVSSIPIGYQYVRHHVSHGLRIGQELLIDTMAVVSRQPVDELYFPMTVLWVALIPGCVAGAAAMLGLRHRCGLVAGAVLSLGSLEMYQLFNENSAAALGVALAPLALAVVADALDPLPGQSRIPLVASAAVLAGVVGAYGEYVSLLLPAFALAAVLRRPPAIPAAVRRLAVLLAISVVVSPLAWWHAMKGTVFHLGEPFLGWLSPFLSASPRQFAVRWIGAGDLVSFGADRSRIALFVFAVGLAGLALAVTVAPRRRLWLALLLASAVLVTYLSTVRRITYSEQRAVLYSQPLLLLAAAAGFAALLQRTVLMRRRLVRPAGVVALAASVALFAMLNLRSDLRMATPNAATLAHRTVGADFDDVDTWVRHYGGSHGDDVLVVSGDFFDQLWLAYTLRDRAAVAYATFEPAYVDIGPCRYLGPSPLWDGRPRRYLLVDRQSLVLLSSQRVVASNGRFLLVDARSGPLAVAAVPRVEAEPQPGRIPVDGASDMLVLSQGVPAGVGVAIRGDNAASTTATLDVGEVGGRSEQLAVPGRGSLLVPVGLSQPAERLRIVPVQGAASRIVLDGLGFVARDLTSLPPPSGPGAPAGPACE